MRARANSAKVITETQPSRDERSREEPAAATRPAPKGAEWREASTPWGWCRSDTPGGLSQRILFGAWRCLGDLHKELDVGARLAQPVEQQVDRLLRLQGVQHPA